MFSVAPVAPRLWWDDIYFNETLMGCSSLNIDGVSKRVVYSESVSKMQQNGIEKSNFSNGQFLVLCNPTKL